MVSKAESNEASYTNIVVIDSPFNVFDPRHQEIKKDLYISRFRLAVPGSFPISIAIANETMSISHEEQTIDPFNSESQLITIAPGDHSLLGIYTTDGAGYLNRIDRETQKHIESLKFELIVGENVYTSLNEVIKGAFTRGLEFNSFSRPDDPDNSYSLLFEKLEEKDLSQIQGRFII